MARRFAQDGFFAVDRKAAQVAAAFFLGFDGFGTGLQDVEFAVQAVASPSDVHRAAVVFFDGQCVMRQLGDFFVGNGEAVAVFFGDIDVGYRFAYFCFVGKIILMCFEPMVLRRMAGLPAFSVGLNT